MAMTTPTKEVTEAARPLAVEMAGSPDATTVKRAHKKGKKTNDKKSKSTTKNKKSRTVSKEERPQHSHHDSPGAHGEELCWERTSQHHKRSTSKNTKRSDKTMTTTTTTAPRPSATKRSSFSKKQTAPFYITGKEERSSFSSPAVSPFPASSAMAGAEDEMEHVQRAARAAQGSLPALPFAEDDEPLSRSQQQVTTQKHVQFQDVVKVNTYKDKRKTVNKWYSKQDLKILMEHEIRINLRFAIEGQQNNAKINRHLENIHCCWRGFEHIQQHIDKNKLNRRHVRFVLAVQDELRHSQHHRNPHHSKLAARRTTRMSDAIVIDPSEELRRQSRIQTEPDRIKAYKLGLQDAATVLSERAYITKTMVAHNSCTNAPLGMKDHSQKRHGKSRSLRLGGRTVPMSPFKERLTNSLRGSRTVPLSPLPVAKPTLTSSMRSSRMAASVAPVQERQSQSLRENRTTVPLETVEDTRTSKSLRTDRTVPLVETVKETKMSSKSLRTNRTVPIETVEETKMSQSARTHRTVPLETVDEKVSSKSVRASRTTPLFSPWTERVPKSWRRGSRSSRGTRSVPTVASLDDVETSAGTSNTNNIDATTNNITPVLDGFDADTDTDTTMPALAPMIFIASNNHGTSKSVRSRRTVPLSPAGKGPSKSRRASRRIPFLSSTSVIKEGKLPFLAGA